MLVLEAALLPAIPLAEPDLEFLLIGDLRQLLEEAPTRENRRWLLAILDRLLAARAGWHTIGFGPESRWSPLETPGLLTGEIVSQLQRLRDRVAHGAAFQSVAQEVRRSLANAVSEAAML
jgi:hypothetical protein